MTIKEIKEYLLAEGLPVDYPLRGTKQQIISQGVGFFERALGFRIISGQHVTQPERDKVDKIRQKLC